MSTLYIYNPDTKLVIAKIHGETNNAIETKAADLNYDDSDKYGSTYSPAFGFSDGLIDTNDAEEYNV